MVSSNISDNILSSFTPVNLDQLDNILFHDRTDTKFVMASDQLPYILSELNNLYFMLEIDNKRIFTYNTTYLDTDDLYFFREHVTGRLNRSKVRCRTYESTRKSFLEIKTKTNKNKTFKARININPGHNGNINEKVKDFIQQHIPVDAGSLKPTLSSTFNRITLAGLKLEERITLDYDISFQDLSGRSVMIPHISIVELKKNGKRSLSPLITILKKYHIHPYGFSKYCIGMALLNGPPHSNILKPKLLHLNKLDNEHIIYTGSY